MLVMQAVNDGARRQEQQCLEKCVGYQVENARGKGADTQGQEHIANLADGGVGQYALDVILCQRCEGSQQ